MQKLVIRHEPEGNGFRFLVQRIHMGGAKSAPAVELSDPLSIPLASTSIQLGSELAWYLENYLDYPYGPNQQRADRVMAALQAWGKGAFEALFDQAPARDWYRDATRASHTDLQLVIASDDPGVLAWPWEALHDPSVGDLAHHCRIERQLEKLGDPPELHPGLSRERIGILLITARPYEGDIAYRSISRPLIELIHRNRLPAHVKLLRPPTFAQLRQELSDNPGAYHIVHFDGHGGFGEVSTGAGQKFRGPQGQLVFEQEDGSPAPVTADQLSHLLREHRIPIAVLNACQSGMLGAAADDAFASVATALLRAGVRSVVAMGYALYVSAAQEFLPAFYRRLFESGSTAEAVRAGRQALLQHPTRLRGFALQDWLVPVLYQQEPLQLDFAGQAHVDLPTSINMPDEAKLDLAEAPYGLIGRDSAVLELERASRRPPAGLVVHGLGGAGKTTLARGYLEWLGHTQGWPAKVIWISLADVRGVHYVLNRMVEGVLGAAAMAAPDEEKWAALIRQLRGNPYFIVWDNFESVSGSADSAVCGSMPDEDFQALKSFLERLRGGKTKVLITSRTDEAWLGKPACCRISLGGLQGEERQALAQAILTDQAITFDPKNKAIADLIDSLEGHPLMMRAILPKLDTQTAASLQQALEKYMPDADSGDPVERKLHATLRYVEEGLADELKPLLYPIGLHDGFVDADYLTAMSRIAGQPFTIPQILQALRALEVAGLAQELGSNVFRMHPALTRYLHGRPEAADDKTLAPLWQSGFMHTWAMLAGKTHDTPLHKQSVFFAIFNGCIERSRSLAIASDAFEQYAVLTQALASHAIEKHNLPLATKYLEALAHHGEAHGHDAQMASAYQQLGVLAQERRERRRAGDWYQKALEIIDRRGDEKNLPNVYHQLGRLAQDEGDFKTALEWYEKTLEIERRVGTEENLAVTYHTLGRLAEDERQFEKAEEWFRKALEINERLKEEEGCAMTYHQLGTLALTQKQYQAAKTWYQKALDLYRQHGNKRYTAKLYHQLGNLHAQQGNLQVADNYYMKALELKDLIGDEYDAAPTYHQLGMNAGKRNDLPTANAWLSKSLDIYLRWHDEPAAAKDYYVLGANAEAQNDLQGAQRYYQHAIDIFEKRGNDELLAMARRRMAKLLEQLKKGNDGHVSP